MRRDRLIIFARAPRLGMVKRRLAREIGALAALRFHRAQLDRLARAMRRMRRWESVIASTPDAARFPAALPRIPQGRGDLGQRMWRALAGARRAVLIGCDIPAITAADIAAAFRALGRADAVFGPAEDGGYWLVGLGPRRPKRPFASVRWSTEHALADTLANCRRHRVALLRRLHDVDSAADLLALKARRPEGHRPATGPAVLVAASHASDASASDDHGRAEDFVVPRRHGSMRAEGERP